MWHFGFGTAVVTEEFPGGGSVDDHREIATFAEKLVSAVFAEEGTS